MTAEQKPKRIHRIAPCPDYDVERLESWLTDMAKDGWHLEKDEFMGFLPFVQGQPQTVRYRLEPRPKNDDSDSPDAEALALAEEYGWDFVTAYRNFYIYRTARSDAREMNTDLSVQAMALKSVRRRFTLQLAMQALLLVHMLVRVHREFFRYIVTFGSVFPSSIYIFVLVSVIDDMRCAVHIRRLHRQLKMNIPLDHNKPWKKSAPLHRWMQFGLVVLYTLVLILAFSRCTAAFINEETLTADYPGDPPFVTIEDLCPTGTFTEKSFMDYNKYDTLSSFSAPLILEWRQYGTLETPDSKTISGSLYITYYETASPWLAERLFNEFLRNAQKEDHYAALSLPQLTVDNYAAYKLYGNYVLIQHGPAMIHAHVNLEDQADEPTFEEWAILMADRLR